MGNPRCISRNFKQRGRNQELEHPKGRTSFHISNDEMKNFTDEMKKAPVKRFHARSTGIQDIVSVLPGAADDRYSALHESVGLALHGLDYLVV